MASGDLAAWESALRSGQHLTEPQMKSLCRMAIEVLIEEPNLRPVAAPATLCGDIHGQFADLLNLFKVGGEIADTNINYVFMGDMVDRGYNSVETLSLLLVLKVRYADRITLLRGNHESRQVTSVYGFYDECQKKFGGSEVWTACMDVFDCLPIGALIDGKTLCVHGGLSPSIRRLDQMRLIDRRMEIPTEGPFSDIVWSDPDSPRGFLISPRGAGVLYGPNVTREFMHLNGLTLIARAHQLVQEGYRYHFDEEFLVTVWSAPNYCYRCGNLASILTVNEDQSRRFATFDAVDEQYSEAPATQRPAYFL
mmetsp:Transcript_11754/g.36512  ORF Transcript_11754/g.36512 Transcript_11754/m.36512 type:complete len:309 (-) Transcript_11754:94-1020(-)|eukprot:CAMPEP_0174827716 /NCGR_PEP_ID=MMETSP1114-20130205/892_1 /TAXON_ID=312471 /ORGANISM="Neobodo designis, Strain CCAP 1951/1" /LENGTH=308 /DNA_ID=CAMNT_0016061391 /DNA_START=163 /DNA_END=1089 /DNA_ORIENTATION=+